MVVVDEEGAEVAEDEEEVVFGEEVAEDEEEEVVLVAVVEAEDEVDFRKKNIFDIIIVFLTS